MQIYDDAALRCIQISIIFAKAFNANAKLDVVQEENALNIFNHVLYLADVYVRTVLSASIMSRLRVKLKNFRSCLENKCPN